MLSTFLKRAAALIGVIFAWSWTIVLAALDWFGRVTAGRDALTAAGIPESLLVIPWWWPGALALALTALLLWLNWPRPAQLVAVNGTTPPQSPPSPVLTEPAPAKRRYLEAAIVVSGLDKQFPEYRARFARSGASAMFAVEFSVHLNGWMPLRKLNVHYLDRFTRGQAVKFSLVHPDMTDEGMRWFFGSTLDLDERLPGQVVPASVHIRGRVTLHVGDVEEHCYFIMNTIEGPHEMPEVTGEHMFEHMALWEGRDPPNGDATSLFR